MNKSTASPVCVTICLVLLSSRGLQCLPFQNVEQRHARQPNLAEIRPEDAENASTSSPGGHLALLEQTLVTAASASWHRASTEPSGSSLNTTTVEATPQSILGVQSLLGHQRLPVYTTEVSGAAGSRRQLSSNEPETELNENGPRGFLLAAAVTSSNPDNVFSSPVGETTDGDGDAGGPNSTGNLEGGVFAPSILGKGENVHPAEVPQSTTEESVFWLPGDHLPSVLPPAGQSLDSERASDRESPVLATETTAKASLVSIEAFLNLEGDASDRWGHSEVTPGAATAVSATVLGHDDWDDTKPGAASPERATPAGLVHRPQLVTESSPAEGRVEEDDEVKMVVTPRLSAPTVKGGQTVQTGSAQEPAQGGETETLLPSQDLAQATNPPPEGQVPVARATEKPGQVAETHEALVTIDTTKSDVFQTPRDTLRGVTQETETAFHETDAVLPATVPGDFASLEVTGDARVRELATQIPTVLGSSTEPRKPEDFAAATSPSATDMSVIPVLESGGPIAALRREEEDTPIDDMPTTPAGLQTEEISGTTMPMSALPSAAAPARRITVLASHQVTTAAAYSLEGLESEEEEEEEDEEEEDEEEEPDEEDEEEDDEDEKDANSMDESLDGDAGQSSFTLPGETSQDPLESLENPVGELSGVSYQVPGAIEWERQNQGLVRNWMKKLKDKAGYMSGMLVPVGVGIAGALMILVALYSVKIMNRQRRNGFKRHKQKREFNSMQDRVMLLADSSEDEF